ncbi:MAG: DHA2 family efflux MFS transporter permease subunit [Peptococcaceae bacterium]
MEHDTEKTIKVDWAAISVLILGTFMAMLDSNIVNVALPKMMAVFGASQDNVEWILTGYMLTLGVVMPLSGYLGDTIGYKKIFMASLTLFIVGSTLCGMAWNLNSMIFARIIQAIGGGLMLPLGNALLFMYSPREKMGMVMGIFGISIMFAPAIGPCLGGYIVDNISWRMIFYINVPVGIINFILASISLKETELTKGKNFDKLGLLFSSLGFFSLLLALSKAAGKGWDSPLVIGLFVVSVVSLSMFVIVELRHPEPILELRVFKNPVFTISILIMSIVSIGLFGAMFLIPLYIQNILGFSATTSGLIMFPAAVASGIMMPIAGRIYDKMGARWVVFAGLAILTYTTYMLHVLDLATPFALLIFWLALRGVGLGLCNMPVMTAGMNTVPQPLIGKASAIFNVMRQVSASMGIAVFTTILQKRAVFHIARLSEAINLNSDTVLASSKNLSDLAISQGMAGQTMQTVFLGVINGKIRLTSEAYGISDCFIISAVVCLIALALSLFLKEKKKSANDDHAKSPAIILD